MKYKRLKRIAGLLLSAVFAIGSLAGCSQNGNSKSGGDSTGDTEGQAMGRYLEEEISLPAAFFNIYDMKKLEDGTIRFVGAVDEEGIESVWDSKDGGLSWERVYDFPAELSDTEKGYVDSIALSSNGQAVCVYNEIENEDIKAVCYLLNQEGAATRMPFELPELDDNWFSNSQVFQVNEDDMEEGGNSFETGDTDEAEEEENNAEEGAQNLEEENSFETGDTGSLSSNLIMGIKFLGNDQILVQDIADTIYQVKLADGSIVHTYEFDGSVDFHEFYSAGKMILVQSSSEVLLYDSETGEQQDMEEAMKKGMLESGSIHAIDTMDNGESIYYLCRNGLYYYKFGGTVTEQLIDGSMNSLGSPSFYVTALVMLDTENLLVVANDTTSGVSMLKYTYSPDVAAKPSKELKVYSLYESTELRQAISKFQKEHTDMYVNYEVALTEENGVTLSDALKTLTTEIMAGKGPDVLVLDGMPVENYVEKGILKDISSVAAGKEDSYFENILKAYENEKGQLCAIPARFFIPLIQSSSTDYAEGEDFAAFTAQEGILAGMEPESVIRKFWYSCGSTWQKEDGTLDETKLTEFLTGLKNAYGEYDSDSIEEDLSAVTYSVAGGVPVLETALSSTSLSNEMFSFMQGKIKVNIGLFGGNYEMVLAANRNLVEGGILELMPGQAEHVFVPAMTLGVNSKSTQTELAEQFVSYLLSKEAQSVTQNGGLPIEKEAFRSAIDGHEYENVQSLVGVAGVGDDDIISYELVPQTEEEIQRLTELVESLTTPALQDQVIMEAVEEQGEKVLKGELSPEEAVSAIMQKVNLYLAE